MNVQVRLYMIKSILIFLVFSFSLLHSQTLPNSTTKTYENDIVSLDTNQNDPDSFWYMLEEDLSEEEIQSITESKFKTKEWKQIAVPGNLYQNKEHYAAKKTVTLAKWVQFPQDSSKQLSFRLGVINDRDRTYLNGKLIGQTGEWNATDPQAYDKLRFYNIPSQLIQYGKKNLLLIRIQPYFGNSGGIEQDETLLGPTDKVNARFYKDEFIKLL
ncbi:stage II sporulation protein E, partial [Leptospira bourretii]